MLADGRIYALNHDVKKLEQHHDDGNSGDGYTPHLNDTYHVNEEAKPRQAKMITIIVDMLQVIRDMPQPQDPKETQVLTLIQGEDN